MKHLRLLMAMIFTSSVFLIQKTNAQSIPTEAEVKNFLNNNHFLVTYREGEAVYGTYYFMEVHYCPSGYYGLYGRSVKKTVLGNEQTNNWQEFGNWKVIKLNGNVGVYYKTTLGQEKFFPAYRLSDGTLSFGNGVSVVLQGKAICQ